MPLSLSPAADMLATIRDYLEREILPELREDKWFNAKVAANMLGMIERELRLGPAANAEEDPLEAGETPDFHQDFLGDGESPP